MKYTDNFKWQVPELSEAGSIENVTQVFDSVDESLNEVKRVETRYKLFKKAFVRFNKTNAYKEFIEKNKEWLFESFGNQFIHSKEIKVTKPNNSLRDEFRTNRKLDTYYLLMMSNLEEEEFVHDVSLKQWVSDYCCARRNICDFIENKYSGPDINCVINKKKVNIVFLNHISKSNTAFLYSS